MRSTIARFFKRALAALSAGFVCGWVFLVVLPVEASSASRAATYLASLLTAQPKAEEAALPTSPAVARLPSDMPDRKAEAAPPAPPARGASPGRPAPTKSGARKKRPRHKASR